LQTSGSAPAQPAGGAAGTQSVPPGPATSAGASEAGTTSPPVNPPPEQATAPNATSVTTSAPKLADMKSKASQPSGDHQAESQASTQPPPDPAQIAALDHEMDQISSREVAAKASLDSLQREQSAQGLQLRGDIVAVGASSARHREHEEVPGTHGNGTGKDREVSRALSRTSLALDASCQREARLLLRIRWGAETVRLCSVRLYL
jgi:hypothetical protein